MKTVPATIDEYRLLRPLGAGVTSSVYLAHDTRRNRTVAVKVAKEGFSVGAASADFLAEARAIAAVRHPNVVSVHGAGVAEGRPYLVCEYVRGRSLASIPKPLPSPRFARIAVGLARGLAAVHARGAVHGDLQPANVLVDERGDPRIVDFGIEALLARVSVAAPAVRLAGGARGSSRASRTAYAGTPLYRAPELWRGARPSSGSDVYALGTVLYELLAGEPPLAGAPPERLSALVLDPPPPLRERAPWVDEALARVVARCLEPHPISRFADGEAVRVALEGLLRVPAIEGAPTSEGSVSSWAPPSGLMGRGHAEDDLEGIVGGVFGDFVAGAAAAAGGDSVASPATPGKPSLRPVPHEEPARSPAGDDGFVPPDTDLDLQIEQRLRRIPPGATVKGIFFRDVLAEVQRCSGALPTEQRFLPFRDYPLRDWLEVLVEGALLAYPDVTPREGIRRIGQRAYPLLLETLPGRVLFSLAGASFESALRLASRGLKLAQNFGSCEVEPQGPGRVLLRLRDLLDWPDAYYAGVFEGALLAFELDGKVLVRAYSLGDVDILVRWRV